MRTMPKVDYELKIGEMFAECSANAPNFGVNQEAFSDSLRKTIDRYLDSSKAESCTPDVPKFLDQIQLNDLYLALACANGNERAWWEFDMQHRNYLERVARHLAKTDVDAQEVIDQVYVELYGTKIVDGERVSKFATYSGRGSLRGWLRTVIWHSLVDLHRASHDEVSLDEMTENVGEGVTHSTFANQPEDGEVAAIDKLTRDRYRSATVFSIRTAFSSLEDHEKLLLLLYHVENLKLREIARLVENNDSPLRGWFQRKSQTRSDNPNGKIHESTIMRWLEKSYGRIFQLFRANLSEKYNFSDAEIDECTELATGDLSASGLFAALNSSDESVA